MGDKYLLHQRRADVCVVAGAGDVKAQINKCSDFECVWFTL